MNAKSQALAPLHRSAADLTLGEEVIVRGITGCLFRATVQAAIVDQRDVTYRVLLTGGGLISVPSADVLKMPAHWAAA